MGTSKNSIRGIFRIAKQKCDFCLAPFLKQLPVREMGSISYAAGHFELIEAPRFRSAADDRCRAGGFRLLFYTR